MQAWSGPDVPILTSDPGLPRIHDTASGRLVEVGEVAGPARLYVCGITPYDATHLGHANTYIAFDLLHRAWLAAGRSVVYTQNVTDVDDPLLERADATGVNWEELAAAQIDLFRTDMVALRVLPPTHYIGAVESMPWVAELVERLITAGLVYQVDDPVYPDWYFEYAKVPGSGGVAHLDREAAIKLFGERGGDPDRPGKRDALDCLVWRMERPGEPAWDSPLGRGRAGWHIECVAMALKTLGEHFDVQGGGSDLAFPHHDMSAAEGAAATGRPFANAYAHGGMVGYQGEKMSKSKGNLVLVSSLREQGVDPMAIRLVLLGHHYRDDWEYTDADLKQAQARLSAWRRAMADSTGIPAAQTIEAIRAALRDDLDAPAALAAVDAWVAASADIDCDTAGPGQLQRAVDALLGISLADRWLRVPLANSALWDRAGLG